MRKKRIIRWELPNRFKLLKLFDFAISKMAYWAMLLAFSTILFTCAGFVEKNKGIAIIILMLGLCAVLEATHNLITTD